jgi:23S rRNA pseudouridine1911/1915/1917 synthase
VLARTSKSLERMNAAFRNKNVGKIYWAVVKNRPPEIEGRLVHYLQKKQANNTTRAFQQARTDAKESVLTYKLIAQSKDYYLLEVRPITGRSHQIRVQLSTIGCSIKGDIKYGFPRANEDRSIHLHARSIIFPHPVTKEMLTITAEPPEDDPLWKAFSLMEK